MLSFSDLQALIKKIKKKNSIYWPKENRFTENCFWDNRETI